MSILRYEIDMNRYIDAYICKQGDNTEMNTDPDTHKHTRTHTDTRTLHSYS